MTHHRFPRPNSFEALPVEVQPHVQDALDAIQNLRMPQTTAYEALTMRLVEAGLQEDKIPSKSAFNRLVCRKLPAHKASVGSRRRMAANSFPNLLQLLVEAAASAGVSLEEGSNYDLLALLLAILDVEHDDNRARRVLVLVLASFDVELVEALDVEL